MNTAAALSDVMIATIFVVAVLAGMKWLFFRSPALRISLEEFDERRSQPDCVVLDVRTPAEFAAGHVPGAVNLNVLAPDFRSSAAALDKTKTYLIHCAHGGRSALAARRLHKLGFPQLQDFSGGWSAWARAGRPVAR